jgi:hypothetical protein
VETLRAKAVAATLQKEEAVPKEHAHADPAFVLLLVEGAPLSKQGLIIDLLELSA